MWHVASLEFVLFALMRILVVAEGGVTGYDCLDPCIVHGGCAMIIQLLSGVQHCIVQYGSSQIVTGCSPDLAAAYLEH